MDLALDPDIVDGLPGRERRLALGERVTAVDPWVTFLMYGLKTAGFVLWAASMASAIIFTLS